MRPSADGATSESVLSPCGRCRELISQFQGVGEKTLVMVKGRDILPIDELLPFDWRP